MGKEEVVAEGEDHLRIRHSEAVGVEEVVLVDFLKGVWKQLHAIYLFLYTIYVYHLLSNRLSKNAYLWHKHKAMLMKWTEEKRYGTPFCPNFTYQNK